MITIQWAQNSLKNENTQKHLEQKVIDLMPLLEDRNEYQKEKCIKSFCEGIGYLENCLLYQRMIHPSQINSKKWIGNQQEYFQLWNEVEKIIINEINRQYRHFSIFL